jgi:hypothetical protein
MRTAFPILLLISIAGCYSRPLPVPVANPPAQPAVVAAGNMVEWRWSEDKATLAFCTKQYMPDFDVEKEKPMEYYSPINIRSKKTGKMVYSYKDASIGTVFTRSKDILYVAEHSPIATGCEVVAINLNTGEQVWRTRLKGLGHIIHEEYSNEVNIGTDGNQLIVWGKEHDGRYIEHLDVQSGKTTSNQQQFETWAWKGD